MGTRGAIGIRRDGEDKVYYNHWDSYPSGLGVDMLRTIACFTDDELSDHFDLMVNVKDTVPTPEQIEFMAPYTDLGVSNQSTEDWYCLTRGVQGDLTAIIRMCVPFYEDSSDFLADSLFCEWAYIINLDEGVLEIYKGFNTNPDAPGRYAHLKDRDYHGVVLHSAVGLDTIRENLTDEIESMKNLESDED